MPYSLIRIKLPAADSSTPQEIPMILSEQASKINIVSNREKFTLLLVLLTYSIELRFKYLKYDEARG